MKTGPLHNAAALFLRQKSVVLIVGVVLPDDPAAKCFNDMYLSAKSQRAVGDAGPYHNDENLKRAAA